MGCKKAYPRFLVSRLWDQRISPIKIQIQIQIFAQLSERSRPSRLPSDGSRHSPERLRRDGPEVIENNDLFDLGRKNTQNVHGCKSKCTTKFAHVRGWTGARARAPASPETIDNSVSAYSCLQLPGDVPPSTADRFLLSHDVLTAAFFLFMSDGDGSLP